ncbi:succinate dehydrogenase, hydrophobic membrane anchor protein [Novosphingobium piscinae]|uniref:Succinate dehydrogenase hydrophobic membrane anchor subunit n=1 Tax=Novosphingobium piscinae TaxID=1507448 RepID=A0A7X1KP31_9SPHN|nr:succinate dehydrogenase, hydrophobic membrane anchor protein [Novosphingobium piscinae]MBC2668053.1 succinate dehydrogenase, hydrophobic membrane anchor protein [Novosphingobium piscinae]
MGNGTSIGRVRGLGSAHSGAGTWLQERVTGLASLIVSLYLLVSLLLLPAYNYLTVKAWISAPLPATAMVLFVIVNFWHARAGLRVVIEDYQHEHGSKLFFLLALDLFAFAGAAFGVLSIVRLALGA